MGNIVGRILRAIRLDASLYEEVEHDSSAMGQAIVVVVLSSIAAGIGYAGHGIGVLIGGIVAALIRWYIWAYITYFVGTRILPEPQTQADHGELLRTIGFASAPGLIRVLGVVPGLVGPIQFVADAWMLAAMVVAVRQALDYTSTFRAVGVCFIGWIINLVLALGMVMLLRGLAA
jgi:hypothetical protein